jgi:hypothetical protein
MLDFLTNLWDKFSIWFDVRSKPFNVIYQNELPDVFEKKTIYIVGEDENYWCIAMLCPCGCNAIIQLNLLSQTHPKWSFFHTKDATITIMPSIWRNIGCRSHFYIRKGRLVWYKSI